MLRVENRGRQVERAAAEQESIDRLDRRERVLVELGREVRLGRADRSRKCEL